MGLTVIAFIGSVFSPYYKWARRRGDTDPLQYCSINVALYGRGGKRWAMTERPRTAVHQTADRFAVGSSALGWNGECLTIEIEEITFPIPSRLRGVIRVTPRAITETQVSLDAPGNHSWWPIAPISDVEVAFEKPARCWKGVGYFDSNWGGVPLETSFSDWTWSRADLAGDVAILYDVNRRGGHGGDALLVALRIGADGTVTPFDSPPEVALPRTGWRINRPTRSDTGSSARVIKTLEDTPFYARSVIEAGICGHTATAMHESLSLDRFATPVVQFMLPFKMPRVRR